MIKLGEIIKGGLDNHLALLSDLDLVRNPGQEGHHECRDLRRRQDDLEKSLHGSENITLSGHCLKLSSPPHCATLLSPLLSKLRNLSLRLSVELYKSPVLWR